MAANIVPTVEHCPTERVQYGVVRIGNLFYAFDPRTGKKGFGRLTHNEAQQDITALLIRNMMHA